MKKYLILIGLFLLAILLLWLVPQETNYHKAGKLYINEIMASNSYTISDEDHDYSDYIELYNGYDYDIDLTGYYLTDSEYDIKKWSFPSVAIKKHDYLIIFASGKDKKDEYIHTNFKLSSSGEVLTLIDNNGNIISKVEYSNMDNDISYGFIKNKYIYTEYPTPGKENSDIEYKKSKEKEYPIIINEYMTHNKKVGYLLNGGYYDWVELYNKSDDEVLLENVYISDNKDNLTKYKLPNVSIKAQDYLVVYLTGEVNVDGYICANFKLSDDDKNIVLSTKNKIIDQVDITILKDNISYGRKDDKWYYFATPTPGKENNTASFEKI